jgi:hypothetical protein
VLREGWSLGHDVNNVVEFPGSPRPGYTVELYELAPGTVRVREFLPTSAGEQQIFKDKRSVATLTDAYRALHPGATDVPAAVRETGRVPLNDSSGRYPQGSIPPPRR